MATQPCRTIEALESRIAPAIVTVDFTGGILTLTGDGGDHSFTIEALDPTTFELSGGVGTQFQMGSDPAVDRLRLTGAIKSLEATLGDAADSFDIIGLNVAGDVTIDAGNGVNGLELISLTTKGSLTITGGTGSDDVILGSGAVLVKKNLTVDLGDGANHFRAASSVTRVGGTLSYTGGSGADSIELAGGNVLIQKNASFLFGAGNANLQVQTLDANVGKDLLFDSSATTALDTSSLGVNAGQIGVGGTFHYRDGAGATTILGGPFVTKQIARFEAITGAGTYNISNALSGARSVSIDASESSGGTFNTFGLGGALTQSTRFIGGDGNDVFTSANSSAASVSIDLDLGEGDNSANVQLFATAVKSINISGGSGKDDIVAAALNSRIAGNITIDAGAGRSSAVFQLFGSSIKGAISMTNGADPGESSLAINSSGSDLGAINFATATASSNFSVIAQGSLDLTGGIRFTGGDGNDTVTLAALGGGSISKGISLEFGEGNNTFNANLANLTAKSLTVNGGDGNDVLTLTGNANLGAVKLGFGAGANSTNVAGQPGAYFIAKAFAYTSTSAAADFDNLALARLQVLGKFSAAFGDGSSILQLDNSILGSVFSVDTGGGADAVRIDTLDAGTGVVLSKAVVILLGDGNDLLQIGGNGTTQLLTTKSTFKADGGGGTNTLTDSPTNNYKKDPVFDNFV